MEQIPLRVKILVWLLDLYYRTPWGMAAIHWTWTKYKQSHLYDLRVKDCGHNEAARLLTYKEWKRFNREVYKDKKFWFNVLPWPFDLEKLYEEDAAYKVLIKF
jgi:hypothetical protein